MRLESATSFFYSCDMGSEQNILLPMNEYSMDELDIGARR